MALVPITKDGRPNPQGLYDRLRILEWMFAGDLATTQAFLATQGVASRFNYVPHGGTYAASYLAFVIDGNLCFCIEGTQTVGQMVGHVVGAFSPELLPNGVKVNSWFFATATQMFSDWSSDVAHLESGATVEIFGHSYGGAVAGIFGLLLKQAFPSRVVNVATYGSPRAMAAGWPGPPLDDWWRVRNAGDVVTVIPPSTLSTATPGQDVLWALKTGRIVTWDHYGDGVLLPLNMPLTTDYSDFVADTNVYIGGGNSDPITQHSFAAYMLALSLSPGALDSDKVWADPVETADPIATGGLVTIPAGPANPSLYAEMNQAYYGVTDGPLTPDTIGAAQGSALRISDVRQSSGNIADFLGGASMAVPGPCTKVTMCINNGLYGRSESHVVFTPLSNLSTLFPQVLELCNRRALLLGNNTTPGTLPVKSLACPQIEFVKLTDPVNPKIGQVIPVGKYSLFGPSTSNFGGQPADTFFSDLSMRITGTQNAWLDGTTGTPPANTRPSTLQLSGNPDVVIDKGVYNGTIVNVGATTTHIQGVLAYLNMLIGTANGTWGFLGLGSDQPKLPISNWAQIAGPPASYTFAATGNNWVTGDRVVITGANPVFNKIFRLTMNAGIATLQNPPVSGHSLPTGGYAQRIQNAGGTTAKSFWKYTATQTGIDGNTLVKVTKKDPGRQFLGVSFRSKRRRER